MAFLWLDPASKTEKTPKQHDPLSVNGRSKHARVTLFHGVDTIQTWTLWHFLAVAAKTVNGHWLTSNQKKNLTEQPGLSQQRLAQECPQETRAGQASVQETEIHLFLAPSVPDLYPKPAQRDHPCQKKFHGQDKKPLLLRNLPMSLIRHHTSKCHSLSVHQPQRHEAHCPKKNAIWLESMESPAKKRGPTEALLQMRSPPHVRNTEATLPIPGGNGKMSVQTSIVGSTSERSLSGIENK